jgi:hypothetical protein
MDAKSVITSPAAQYPLQRGFVEIRGLAEPFGSFYHYNAIQSWKVASDGSFHNVHA